MAPMAARSVPDSDLVGADVTLEIVASAGSPPRDHRFGWCPEADCDRPAYHCFDALRRDYVMVSDFCKRHYDYHHWKGDFFVD